MAVAVTARSRVAAFAACAASGALGFPGAGRVVVRPPAHPKA
jgi:hypothetical protein